MTSQDLTTLTTIKPKPFVKWPGGKRRLLPELVSRLPNVFERYYEPFLGGGALYFHIQPNRAYISDINPELINAYRVIQDRVEDLISVLPTFKNTEEDFYNVRELDRTPNFKQINSIERAARFIYLNKTCFNGLYRENSKGHFNVPFGHYDNPTILDEDNLIACHDALKGATIGCESFLHIVSYAKPGDFVYFDPPYMPDNISSTFTSYSKDGFGMADHENLINLCEALNRNSVKWMLSNSSAPIVYKMYKNFNIETIEVQRSIGASASTRKKVEEVIVRNY